jgi:ABC-type sugar transport system substrate-binding protein
MKMGSVRVLAALLALFAVAVIAAGCGSSSSGSSSSETSGSSETTETTSSETGETKPVSSKELGLGEPSPAICEGNEYHLGVDVFSDTQPEMILIREGIEKAAEETGCTETSVSVNNVDPNAALQDVQSFIQEGVDGVITADAVAAEAQGQAKLLENKGIPFVQMAAVAPKVPIVVDREHEAGLIDGEKLGEAYEATGNKAVPYFISGRNDASGEPYVGFYTNVEKGVEKTTGMPNSNVIRIDVKTDPALATSATKSVLAKIPGDAPILLHGPSEETTEAILKAVESDPNHSGPVMTIAGRAYAGRKEAVCANEAYVGMLDFQYILWGKYLVPDVIAQIQGKEVPETVYTPFKYSSREELCK